MARQERESLLYHMQFEDGVNREGPDAYVKVKGGPKRYDDRYTESFNDMRRIVRWVAAYASRAGKSCVQEAAQDIVACSARFDDHGEVLSMNQLITGDAKEDKGKWNLSQRLAGMYGADSLLLKAWQDAGRKEMTKGDRLKDKLELLATGCRVNV